MATAAPGHAIDEAPTAASPQHSVANAAPPAGAGSFRIVIHYPAHRGDVVPAIKLAALLQIRGFRVAGIRPVDVEVERPSVRYFFAKDRARSERLVDTMSVLLPNQAPGEATDFSHFSPKPSPGTVEVWLPAGGPGPLAQDSR